MKCQKCGAENHEGAVSCSLCCAPFNTSARGTSIYRGLEEKPKPPRHSIFIITGILAGSAFLLTLVPLDIIPFIFFKGPSDDRYSLRTSWYLLVAAIGAFGGIAQHFYDSIDTTPRLISSLGSALAGIALAVCVHGFVLTDQGYKLLDKMAAGKASEDSGPEPELRVQPELLSGEYTDELHGFSIQPPDGWSESAPGTETKAVFLGAEIDGIVPQIQIVFMSDTDRMDDSWSPSRRKLAETFMNIEVLNDEDCIIGGKSARRLVVAGDQHKGRIKGMAVIVDCKLMKWLIIGYASKNKYNEFANIFYSSMDSFKTLE